MPIPPYLTPGNFDIFRKALFHLSFMPNLKITQGVIDQQFETNAFIECDLSSVLGGVDMHFIIDEAELKEFKKIDPGNLNVYCHEDNDYYSFQGGLCVAPIKKIDISYMHPAGIKINGQQQLLTSVSLTESETKKLVRIIKNTGSCRIILDVHNNCKEIINQRQAKYVFSFQPYTPYEDQEDDAAALELYSFCIDKVWGEIISFDIIEEASDDKTTGGKSYWIIWKAEIGSNVVIKLVERLMPKLY